MAITLNGKPLHKSQTPPHKIFMVKLGIENRDSVEEICKAAGVTQSTVLQVREGILK